LLCGDVGRLAAPPLIDRLSFTLPLYNFGPTFTTLERVSRESGFSCVSPLSPATETRASPAGVLTLPHDSCYDRPSFSLFLVDFFCLGQPYLGEIATHWAILPTSYAGLCSSGMITAWPPPWVVVPNSTHISPSELCNQPTVFSTDGALPCIWALAWVVVFPFTGTHTRIPTVRTLEQSVISAYDNVLVASSSQPASSKGTRASNGGTVKFTTISRRCAAISACFTCASHYFKPCPYQPPTVPSSTSATPRFEETWEKDSYYRIVPSDSSDSLCRLCDGDPRSRIGCGGTQQDGESSPSRTLCLGSNSATEAEAAHKAEGERLAQARQEQERQKVAAVELH